MIWFVTVIPVQPGNSDFQITRGEATALRKRKRRTESWRKIHRRSISLLHGNEGRLICEYGMHTTIADCTEWLLLSPAKVSQQNLVFDESVIISNYLHETPSRVPFLKIDALGMATSQIALFIHLWGWNFLKDSQYCMTFQRSGTLAVCGSYCYIMSVGITD